MGGERDFEDVDVVIWLAWGGGGDNLRMWFLAIGTGSCGNVVSVVGGGEHHAFL